MINGGWTGGQYSGFRMTLGALLFVRFTALAMDPDLPATGNPLWLVSWVPSLLEWSAAERNVVLLMMLGALLTIPLMLGIWDKLAALLLGYLLVSIHNFSPHAAAGAPAALALVLLLHAFTPGAPYGSLAARGRPDPGGRWHFPRGLYLVGWTFFLICWVHRLIDSLILGDRASGLFGVPVWAGILIVMLLASVEVVALVLSLNRRIRPYAWVVLLGMRVVWAGAVGINNANEGLLLLLLFVFNPGWIAAAGKGHEVVFYDGHCSLCQGVVRFLLAEDRRGVFRFAPIGGEAYTRMIPEEKRRSLPDSVIVLRTDGELLVRSAATLHLAERVGGIPRIKAQILNRLPRRVNDAWYELVARNRNRLFPRKESSCPLIPERHRAKMLP